jgi:hypothetical protein
MPYYKIVHDNGDHNCADLMTKAVTAAVEEPLSKVITGNQRMVIPENEASQFWARQDSIRKTGTTLIALPPPKRPLEEGLPTSLSDDTWECEQLAGAALWRDESPPWPPQHANYF